LAYTFIDFFCGAGGFTEGFRQQGFKPIRGIEMWQPALNTHNLNFGLDDKVKNVLEFEDDEEIEILEDSDIILGSPPCVSFSMANKAGKADKSLGIRLIEAFLRVVAVKKHQKNSILKAWYMENVPNSKNYIQETYTFEDLNLDNWAKKNNFNPKDIALTAKENGAVLNASEYGSPQKRERFICGEFIEDKVFLYPVKTHTNEKKLTLKDIRSKIPSPISKELNKEVVDPNYPSLKCTLNELTDHTYDTGLYKIEWEKAKRAKVNHPFMGKMSFPENENNPSRTIMATKAGSTRESLIYKSEYSQRVGNGEYRMPTIREAATLMGFPYLFNFTGTEGTKWKQIGNAVCPHMSFALAKALNKRLTDKEINHDKINFSVLETNNKQENLEKYKFNNLNNQTEKTFNKEPKRTAKSKFRRHILKGGNMTVSLLNYSPVDNNTTVGKDWSMYVFLGSGNKFQSIPINKNEYITYEKYILENLPTYKQFISSAKNLCTKIPNKLILHELYIQNNTQTKYLDIETFFERAEELLNNSSNDVIFQSVFQDKKNIPISQLLSIYLLNLYFSNIK